MTVKYDLSKYISFQPFWNIKMKNSQTLHDAAGSCVAHIFETENQGPLDCVPGIGLNTIMLSLDKNNPQAIISGTIELRQFLPTTNGKEQFTCRFLPGEFFRLFGIPGSELSPEGFSLDEVMPTNSLKEQMALSQNFEERKNLIKNFIINAKNNNSSNKTSSITNYVISAILNSGGDLRMRELEDKTGYSARYIQTIIKNAVGLSPSQLCGHARFQQALHYLSATDSKSILSAAQKCGFYDQSHFNRVFKDYIGVCPSDYIKSLPKPNRY